MKRLAMFICCMTMVVSAFAEAIVVDVVRYNEVAVAGGENVAAEYMQYQSNHYKSRLQAGDSAVLQLTNLPQGQLLAVSLFVKSNQSSGAGSMRLSVDGQSIWSIYESPFKSENWNGAYATDWVEVRHLFRPDTRMGNMRLVICATQNSLYFSGMSIVYAPDTAAVNDTTSVPPAPPTKSDPILADTTFTSGEYAILMLNYHQYAAIGGVHQHKIDVTPVVASITDEGVYALEQSYVPTDWRYQVDFSHDTLYITHVRTSEPIGYEKASRHYQLASLPAAWHWQETRNHTLLLTHNDDGDYCAALLLHYTNGDENVSIQDEWIRRDVDWTYVALIPTAGVPTDPSDAASALSDVEAAHTIDWTRPVRVYSLTGLLLHEGILQSTDLPSGCKIVRQGTVVLKMEW